MSSILISFSDSREFFPELFRKRILFAYENKFRVDNI